MHRVVLAAVCALSLAACATQAAMGQPHAHAAPATHPSAAPAKSAPKPAPVATAAFIANDRTPIGEAMIWEGPQGLVVRIMLQPGALTPGWRALHVHAKADCSDQNFQASGPHAGHGAGMAHGLLHPQGPEVGDLTNIWVPEGAPAGGEFFLPFMTVTGAAGRAPMLDADGSAFVIHANPDDHVSQPIGGAGPRVACAVIEPVR